MQISANNDILLSEDTIFEKFATKNVTEDIENFFVEYFSASVKIENKVTQNGVVSISHVGFARIFRSVINHIFGESQLKIKMLTEKNLLLFVFNWTPHNDIAQLLRSIKSAADLSGFSATALQNDGNVKITFSTNLMPRGFIPIYAKSKKKIYQAFTGVFITTGDEETVE